MQLTVCLRFRCACLCSAFPVTATSACLAEDIPARHEIAITYREGTRRLWRRPPCTDRTNEVLPRSPSQGKLRSDSVVKHVLIGLGFMATLLVFVSPLSLFRRLAQSSAVKMTAGRCNLRMLKT